LTELGLTILQAKVYLTLAKSRNLRASEIATLSGVARPDVYRVLIQLEENGLVEVIMSKPEVFRSIAIEQCVANLIQKRIMKTADLQQKGLKLTQYFKRNVEDREPEEKFQFILIPNRDAVYIKAEKMLKNVQKSICFLALRRRMIAWLSNYRPILEEALERGVFCQVIMPKPDLDQGLGEPIEILSKYHNFSMRLISESPPNVGFSVWDRKEILLSTSSVDTPFPFPTLWSNNKSIVELSQDYFDCIWQKAQETNSTTDEHSFLKQRRKASKAKKQQIIER
jgi:sugar-specific transcriptional regulator TrmB